MKILTWNINGIRSLKRSIKDILKDFDADIVCFQETKISRCLLPEETAIIDGYTSYYSFPKKQSGYSGVASYCKDDFTPSNAEDALADGSYSETFLNKLREISSEIVDTTSLDNEGRTIITYHEIKIGSKMETLAIINVYCPRVDPEKPERHIYKMQFCQLLEARAHALCLQGCHVIVLGDLNIAHHPIDHCDPGDEEEFQSTEPRMWLSTFLKSSDETKLETGFLDAFRTLQPKVQNAYTCWNTLTGARQTNYGTRIDYIIISSSLRPWLSSCQILSEVHGSDHCPVAAEFHFHGIAAARLPVLCTRLWPEFSGKQQKLIAFLQKPNTAITPLKQKSYEHTTSQSAKRAKVTNKGSSNQKTIANFFKTNSGVNVSNGTNDLKGKNSRNGDNNQELYTFNADRDCESTQSSQESGNSICGDLQESSMKKKEMAAVWKGMLSGPPKPPLCNGHNKPCVLRTVKKEGPNFGRQFFSCPQPNGHSSNPNATCNFFKWVNPPKRTLLKNT